MASGSDDVQAAIAPVLADAFREIGDALRRFDRLVAQALRDVSWSPDEGHGLSWSDLRAEIEADRVKHSAESSGSV